MFLLTGFVSCEIVLLHLNDIFTSKCTQTHKELAKIKLQTQIFTTVTPVQFCVSKYLLPNVTSHITIQPCSKTEVVYTLQRVLIRRFPINRFLLDTQSEYHTKFFHSIFNNSFHIAHLT